MMGTRAQVAGALTLAAGCPPRTGHDDVARVMADADRFPNSWQYNAGRTRCVVKHMGHAGVQDGTFEIQDCADTEARIAALRRRRS
jgi:hypothetical protein